ncbi:GNAT family N-acetyltransferase [Legionella nagasakiensis]|uniref:GNAT family N-acetyltransferase n=1 Tax=Legionella nagasakiensis TaxID=535290 RepID=UPI001054EA8E|nr:GNAT family N-acetyltransferase [Legionella nagasakiensis]
MSISIRLMSEQDIPTIMESIQVLDWNRDESVYRQYLEEQHKGLREVYVAFHNDLFAGHINLIWKPPYTTFQEKGIPEISDLIVLPQFRRKGVASALMDECEAAAKQRSAWCGLGVGLYKDYGPAQALYAQRGYQLDCLGVTSHLKPVIPGTNVFVDDDLLIWMVKKL